MRGRGRGRGGLLGGIIQGAVSVTAEYRAHRKEVKEQNEEALRNSNQHHDDPQAGSSASAPGATRQDDDLPPPSYDQLYGDHERHEDHRDMKKIPDDDDEDEDLELVDADEAAWQLDEAVPPYDEQRDAQYATTDELVRDVMQLSRQAQAASNEYHEPLPLPVVIPQRRPRDKKRGFVRAYAPALDDCGIDQQTFLQFLESFRKSSQASPIFPIIQISAGIAGMAPSVIAMAVCTAVQVGAKVGAEMQARSRTNNFLDRMNDELFKPQGLYAMIFKYKSNADGSSSGFMQGQAVDLSTNKIIAKYMPSNTAERTMSDRMRNLRLGNGTTTGRAALPDAAPLIFPDVDRAINTGGKETFKDKVRDAGNFLGEYMDRRAQMKYATSDPDSALNVPEGQRQMRSNLADSNHPMYSGGLVALLSGGKVNVGGLRDRSGRPDRRERREARREARYDRGDPSRRGDNYYASDNDRGVDDRGYGDREGYTSQRGFDDRSGYGGRQGYGGLRGGRGGRGGAIGGIKKLMQEDVLYLLIVNMPSEEELVEARQAMGEN